jgi:uncharacterized protein (DUF1684 family)
MKSSPGILMLLMLLGGCGPPEPGGTVTPAPEAASELSDEAWTRALVEHREETDEEFRTSSTSPMAGAQRLKSEPADRVYLIRQDRTFALAYSADPAAVMAFGRGGAGWTWEDLSGDVAGEADGGPLASGSVLSGPASFDTAEFHVGVYPAEDALTFIVYDPERPEKTAFERLLYFPPDRSFAVPATLHRIPEPEEVEMLTSRSLKKTFYRYATIHFRLDGEDLELTAFKSRLTGEGSEGLFVPFRDATSGGETYGAGRFLDLEEPEGEDLVLDFNRAYNPLCNYSPAYNCPIPPRENRLAVPIRAGERTYPH